MRGLIAAASTAVFFIAACGVKHFSWHERHVKGLSLVLNDAYLKFPNDSNYTNNSYVVRVLLCFMCILIGKLSQPSLSSDDDPSSTSSSARTNSFYNP